MAAIAGFELIQRVLLPAFLTGPLGLPFAMAAPLVLALRLLDVVCDVALGALSDALGARRGMMLAGAATATPATLSVAMAGPHTPFALLALALMASVLGWSAMNAAQAGLSLDIGRDIKGRAEVFAWRTVASIAGLTLLALTTAGAGADTGLQMRWGALALLVATPLLLALLVWRVTPPPAPPRRSFRLAAIVQTAGLAWADGARARLAGVFALAGAQAAIWATGFAFVIQQGLGLPGLLGAALLIQAAAAIAGAFLWLRALKRLGPRRVLGAIFAAEAGFAIAALALPSGHAALALAWVGARGLVAGAEIMVLRALSGNFLTAEAGGGAVAASFQLPFSVAAAIAAAGLLWALDLVGFDHGHNGRAALVVTATLGALISAAAFTIASGLKETESVVSAHLGRATPDT